MFYLFVLGFLFFDVFLDAFYLLFDVFEMFKRILIKIGFEKMFFKKNDILRIFMNFLRFVFIVVLGVEVR